MLATHTMPPMNLFLTTVVVEELQEWTRVTPLKSPLVSLEKRFLKAFRGSLQGSDSIQGSLQGEVAKGS